MRLQKSSNFEQTDILLPHTVILGIKYKGFGFGIWTGSKVLCSCDPIGSHAKNWEEWKFGFDRSVLFKHAEASEDSGEFLN
jgi:hypothetical protein